MIEERDTVGIPIYESPLVLSPLRFKDDVHEAAFSPEVTREALPTVIATCISARCPIAAPRFASSRPFSNG